MKISLLTFLCLTLVLVNAQTPTSNVSTPSDPAAAATDPNATDTTNADPNIAAGDGSDSAAVAAAATYTFDPVTTPLVSDITTAPATATTWTTPNPFSTSIPSTVIMTSTPATSAVIRPAAASSTPSPSTTKNAAPEVKANSAMLGVLAGVMAIFL